MIYFPFVEWLERLIEWAKRYAEPVNAVFYWTGVVVIGAYGTIVLKIWSEAGFYSARGYLVILGAFWLAWLAVCTILKKVIR